MIIVNYNSGERLKKCVRRLNEQTYQNFNVCIIDNASTDGSLDFLGDTEASVIVIKSCENMGFAAANNKAAAQVKGDWLAFLNPDAYAEPDWLEAFVTATARYPDVDAFGSTQLDAANLDQLDGAGDCCSAYGIPYRGGFGWPATTVCGDTETFAACAAAAFYRRQTFIDLGGFDERFFCYGEDVDLGYRLRLMGGRTIQLASARVAHEGSGVSGRRSDFTIYHGHRNRIWLFYKNTPLILYVLTAPLRLIADILLLLKHMVSGGGGAYIRAVRDGYLGLHKFNQDRNEMNSRGRSMSIGRLIVWSPAAVLRRKTKSRPVIESNRAALFAQNAP